MTTLTPLEAYQQALSKGEYQADPAQYEVVQHLQKIYVDFINSQKSRSRFWQMHNRRPIKGLYLWGSVGSGKTWLMDLFFNALPTDKKLRIHFHHFMQEIHQALKELQGTIDPLKKLATQIAKKNLILCFDEFFVNDITDAMLLGNLFASLFAKGVILITTANMPPDQLYYNGLQRNRFLPAIELIKQHTNTIEIHSQMDYRLRTLTQAGIYHYPLNSDTAQKMQQLFIDLNHNEGEAQKTLVINDRPIKTILCSNTTVWFDFQEICHIPRSQLDYLEIAKRYPNVFISNMPLIAATDDNAISYFIKLIDIFYDQRVKLILSAAGPIDQLYPTGPLSFAFQRTQSRLIEMQSQQYLESPHLG